MNKYEMMLIVKSQMTQEEKDTVCKQVSESVNKHGGKVVNTQMWLDKHRLTFTINKASEGTYYLMKFESPGASIEKIKEASRLNEDILRFVITKDQS